jgi:hypothetical protein
MMVFISASTVRLQIVDLDGVVPALFHALAVRVVPEDRNRAPGIQRQLVMPRDLDQLGRLDGLAAPRCDGEGENLPLC